MLVVSIISESAAQYATGGFDSQRADVQGNASD